MEEVLKKCPNCKADVISGQRFCANCGVEQELKLRTKEEIQEMLKRIEGILKLRGPDRGKQEIGTMVTKMLLHMTSESCLKWVLGLVNDQGLLGIFETITKKGKVEEKDNE